MRYNDAKIESSRTKNWNSSGNESLGFESFNRDDCMYFADACVYSVSTADAISAKASVNDWGWSPQGTSSMSYVSDNGEISTLTSSIAALNSCASGIKSNVETVGRALNAMSRRLQEQPHWSDKLDLKNRFSRDGRDLRSQLLTVQKGTFKKMNKEQFKFSISNLINEYSSKLVMLNVDAVGKDATVLHMYEKQVEGLNRGFEEALIYMIDQVFPNEAEKEVEADE